VTPTTNKAMATLKVNLLLRLTVPRAREEQMRQKEVKLRALLSSKGSQALGKTMRPPRILRQKVEICRRRHRWELERRGSILRIQSGGRRACQRRP